MGRSRVLACYRLPSIDPAIFLPLAAVAIVAYGIYDRQRRRQDLAARLRLEWGSVRQTDRDLPAIASYFQSTTAENPDGALDDRTWNDLNLDAVFGVIDRTESTVGQQVLYRRLRRALFPQELEAFEALIARVSSDPGTRENAQIALVRLSHPAGYDLWWLAQPGALEVAAWFLIFPLLTLGSVLSLSFLFVTPWAFRYLLLIVLISLPVRILTMKQLQQLSRAFGQVSPLVAVGTAVRRLFDSPGVPLLAALEIDLPHLRAVRLCSAWLSRERLRLDPLSAAVIEIVNSMFLLDAAALYIGAWQLRGRGASLLRVVDAVGEVDAAISVASFRDGSDGWIRPVFTSPGSTAQLDDLRHPLLSDGVPNSIRLLPPNGVIVTGSNMSGKSTFLRTVGVSAVLAQTINTCLARRYEAPVLRTRSCLGVTDDLLSGKSYYLAEVDSIVSLLKASESNDAELFLIDELFRGTNAAERVAAGEAVLRRLVASQRHVTIVATHDIQLVTLLADCYVPYHFGDQVGADGLHFDYRLKTGRNTTRNAIALLKLQGAPDEVVEAAAARVALLDAAGSS